MDFKSYRSSCAILIFSLLAALPAFGATVTVTSTGDSGAGTLRAAIAAAAPGDTINFSLVYPATITLASPLAINTSLTIAGPGASNLAVSGGNTVGVFQITAGSVAISGLTIENGFGEGGAGPIGNGIYNTATATISDVLISGNSSGSFGGGIYNTASGNLIVTDSTFTNNRGQYGGGILNRGLASITGSTFSQNSFGTCGGAIYNSGTMTLSESTVNENGTNVDGGGICNDGGNLTIDSTTISSNYSVEGGGLISSSGLADFYTASPGSPSVAISRSTVSNNGADVAGGGINASSGTLTITNSTISANHSAFGGALAVAGSAVAITNSTISGNSSFISGIAGGINGSATFKNTILAGNSDNEPGLPNSLLNCAGTFTSDGHNLSDDASCADFFNGPGDLNNTPSGLDPAGLKNNGGPTETIALLSGPGIYSIPLAPVNYCTLPDGTTPVATDQRGVVRPQSPSGCSVGAFEPVSESAFDELEALYEALKSQIKACPHEDKDDFHSLRESIDEVAEMLEAGNWSGSDGNHLERDDSFRFFLRDRRVADELTRLLHEHDNPPLSSKEIQTDLKSLASANRILAAFAIDGAAGKDPEPLVRANEKLSEGDQDVAAAGYELAIHDYIDAWSLAENAHQEDLSELEKSDR